MRGEGRLEAPAITKAWRPTLHGASHKVRREAAGEVPYVTSDVDVKLDGACAYRSDNSTRLIGNR